MIAIGSAAALDNVALPGRDSRTSSTRKDRKHTKQKSTKRSKGRKPTISSPVDFVSRIHCITLSLMPGHLMCNSRDNSIFTAALAACGSSRFLQTVHTPQRSSICQCSGLSLEPMFSKFCTSFPLSFCARCTSLAWEGANSQTLSSQKQEHSQTTLFPSAKK